MHFTVIRCSGCVVAVSWRLSHNSTFCATAQHESDPHPVIPAAFGRRRLQNTTYYHIPPREKNQTPDTKNQTKHRTTHHAKRSGAPGIITKKQQLTKNGNRDTMKTPPEAVTSEGSGITRRVQCQRLCTGEARRSSPACSLLSLASESSAPAKAFHSWSSSHPLSAVASQSSPPSKYPARRRAGDGAAKLRLFTRMRMPAGMSRAARSAVHLDP